IRDRNVTGVQTCALPILTTYEYTQDERQTPAQPQVVPRSKGRIVVNWLTTTDHKTIEYLYLITSFTFFGLAGVMALLIRAELFRSEERRVGKGRRCRWSR